MFGKEKLNQFEKTVDGEQYVRCAEAYRVIDLMEARINDYKYGTKKDIKKMDLYYIAMGSYQLAFMSEDSLREHIYYCNKVFKHMKANHAREICTLKHKIQDLEAYIKALETKEG